MARNRSKSWYISRLVRASGDIRDDVINVQAGTADSDVSVIAQLRREADSDTAVIQSLSTTVATIASFADSDLKVVADLRNDVDSDGIKLQALQETVSNITSFDSDQVVTIINENLTDVGNKRFDYLAVAGDSEFTGSDINGNTLSYTPGTISVYVNGILLNPNNDFTATTGTSVNLSVAADSDDDITIIRSIGVRESLDIQRFDFTAVSAQTSFTGNDDNGNSLGYVAGKIQVFLNGLLLKDTLDYTATNDTSVTLITAADSDDVLTVLNYFGSEVLTGFDSDQVVAIINENLPVDQTGFDSDQVVAIINENASAGFDSDQVVAIINENSSGGGVLSIDADDNIISSNTTSAITAGSGLSNISIGSSAGDAITTGDYNINIGYEAGSETTTQSGQVNIGYQAGNGGVGNYGGSVNIGYAASGGTAAFTSSTAVGYYANNNGGQNVVAVGREAGKNTNDNGTYVGAYAGSELVGTDVTAVGYQASRWSTAGDYSVAVGTNAGYRKTGNYNVHIGWKAGGYTGSDASGVGLVAIGAGANGGLTTGSGQLRDYGIAIGYGAADGHQWNNPVGQTYGQIYIGAFCGSRMQNDNGNVGIGNQVFQSTAVTQMNCNYSVGIGGRNFNTYTSTGVNTSRHVAIGFQAGQYCYSGFDNVYVGYDAGRNTSTGSGNTYIGKGAGGNTNLSNSVVVGYNLTAKGNNTGYIGGSSGIYNEINSNTWQTVSDERIKTNITAYTNGLNKLDLINVKTFNYKSDSEIAIDNPELADSDGNVNVSLNTEKTVVGLIAQELETVLPNSVSEGINGIKSINTDELVWVMLNSIKELKALNEALTARVETLENN